MVAAGYALAVIGALPMLMFGFDHMEADQNYPRSIIQVSDNDTAGAILDAVDHRAGDRAGRLPAVGDGRPPARRHAAAAARDGARGCGPAWR